MDAARPMPTSSVSRLLGLDLVTSYLPAQATRALSVDIAQEQAAVQVRRHAQGNTWEAVRRGSQAAGQAEALRRGLQTCTHSQALRVGAAGTHT